MKCTPLYKGNSLISVFVVLSLVLVAGCMSSGNSAVMDQERLEKITIDVSTKEDVRRLLGHPNGISKQSRAYPGVPPVAGLTNSEVWTYTHMSVDVDGATFIPIVGLFAGGATSHINTLR